MKLNYTSLTYRDEPRMHCAIKALIIILLCQAPFAVGLNFLTSGFQKISTDSSYPSKIYWALNARKLIETLPAFPSSARFFIYPESSLVSNYNMAPIAPSSALSPAADDYIPDDPDIRPIPSLFPPPATGFLSDSDILEYPDQDIPSFSFPAPSPGPLPDSKVIQDPDIWPFLPFNEPAKNIMMVVSRDKFSPKYVIKELPDPDYELVTQIQKMPGSAWHSTSDVEAEELTQEFQMLLLKPRSPIFLIGDKGDEGIKPAIHTVTNSVLSFILKRLTDEGAKYTVIYNDNGTVVVKVQYADGSTRILSMEDLLFKFGEWFYDFFDAFFDSPHGYAIPHTQYHSQPHSVVIYHKKKKTQKKGDPVKPGSEPVDGQTPSKSTSGRSAINTLPSLQAPLHKTERRHSTTPSDPHPKTPLYSTLSSGGDGASLLPAPSKKPKPGHRFMVARATSELAVAKDLRGRGVRKLAHVIKRNDLRKKFSGLEGFPASKSVQKQIAWLLTSGQAIPLSELIVEKATQQWLDGMAHTLITRHLKRSQSTKRTRVKPSDLERQHAELARHLDTFMREETVFVDKPKPKDHAALKHLLGSGWRIVLANANEAPLYYSSQQQKLLIDASLPNLEDALTVSTQRALEFLLWDAPEALRLSKLINFLVPAKPEAMIKQQLESSAKKAGVIESVLGIDSYIRLVNHPTAGGGRLALGAPQKHIKVAYFNNEPESEYVEIEVSVEFSEITIADPMYKQTKIPVTLALRSAYKYSLHSGVATPLRDRRVVVASHPQLPPAPTAEQIQQWASELREKQTRAFYESLAKVEERFADWENRASVQPPVDIAKLKEDARKLKILLQGFTPNFEYARNWKGLPVSELERVTNRLAEAMKQYQQLLDTVLKDESLFSGPGHEEAWLLVRDYRKYVLDMEDVYNRMTRINRRQEQLTEEDLREIERLVELSEIIGGRARNLNKDELPVRRAVLREKGALTQEQYERTEQLRTLYYPLTSAFNIDRAQALLRYHQASDESGASHKVSTFIPDDEQEEAKIEITPEISPLEMTLPFTFAEGLPGEDEEQELHDHGQEGLVHTTSDDGLNGFDEPDSSDSD